jgi:predicted MPP superfamily phosphohydrolase
VLSALLAKTVSVEPRIVDVSIALPRLPRSLDGFTIAQISDVHAGPTVSRPFVAEVVRRVNALAPDLVAITGDLVDGSVKRFGAVVEPLADLRSVHGTFFVTGNHEYYSGVEPWLAHLRTLAVRVLRNERVSISRPGARNDNAFDLAGIDDHESHRWGGGHGADLERALDGRDPSRALVLMAHQPRQVRVSQHHGVDLQISGHTHGGQIWPWHAAVRIQQGGLLAGHYRFGDTQLYVSRGTGYWGPAIRFGAPAEISRIVLRAA